MTSAPQAIPLVVDLDGTLLRTNTLIEGLFGLLARNPLLLIKALWWLLHGKCSFKQWLAIHAPLNPATLPYSREVLALIQQAHASKQPVVLATAANQLLADRIAAHLGGFAAVYGSDERHNCKGKHKAALLTAHYGTRGFDYAGDNAADCAVWRHARTAYLVNCPPYVQRQVRKSGAEVIVIVPYSSWRRQIKNTAKTLRVYQWLKNLLVFLPALASHSLQPEVLIPLCVAFVAFSFCASSVYILNDLIDLPHDRAHPRKKRRPLASGRVPVGQGVVMAPLLLLASFALAATLPFIFMVVLLGYYGSTFLYSFVLKRIMMIDVLTLAGLYTTRVAGGAAAASLTVSPWLLAFCLFLFLCMAFIKRLTEMVEHLATDQQPASGRGYMLADIPLLRSLGAASGFTAITILALYINSPEVPLLYEHPEGLWFVCLFLLNWLGRALLLANRGKMDDDPLVFALRDRVTAVTGLLCILVVVLSAV